MKRAKVNTWIVESKPIIDMFMDVCRKDHNVRLFFKNRSPIFFTVSEAELFFNAGAIEDGINYRMSLLPNKDSMERAADARLAASRNRKARR